ncbi:beta-ketoacyl-ACP synthase III [Streptomyces sp. SBT349]|uniref:beta-ketoacyl-ACP synthase III n=1 Tax=Streptomyces sp. SBT349 TaxID=1580539 RepID=UPI00066CDDAC|nr:beta-ketoacyl-ACP synthase III [Streptomyces sp. SBT349]
MGARAAVLAGLGSYLPPGRMTNEELSRRLDTSDEWIHKRTGIRERRWVDAGVSTSDLAVEAGQRALKSAANGAPDAVGMVILATTTPDYPCPATAPEVATRLGLGTPAAVDMAAGCAGFVYALATGAASIAAGHTEQVLVIGAETLSTIINPADRTTAVIFADGAGAVVLRSGTADEPGAILTVDLGSDGTGKDLATIPAGGSRQRSSRQVAAPDDRFLHVRGKEIFAQAVRRMGQSATAVLGTAGWSVDQLDHLVGHQANLRILHALAQQLGLDKRRVVSNIEQVGNTSAASIPLALADAAAQNRFLPRDRLLLTAFGAGLCWASAALTWPQITPA